MQFTTLSSDGSHALTPWDAAANDFGMLVNEVVEPVKEYNPYLSWMTGKLPTIDRQMPVGWHVHKGVNPRLDALLTRLGYKHHLIEHENDQGEVELVDYWALNYRWDGSKGPRGEYVLVPVSLFVVARGVRDKREMKHPQDRDGVAYGWEVNRDKKQQIIYKPNGEPKKTAKLKMRAYIRELLPSPEQTWDDANGFLTWFQISVSGYLVDDAGGGLARHDPPVDRTMRDAHACEQQAQIVIDFRDSTHGRAGILAGGLLLDGDRGREALDMVDIGLLHQFQELARIG